MKAALRLRPGASGTMSLLCLACCIRDVLARVHFELANNTSFRGQFRGQLVVADDPLKAFTERPWHILDDSRVWVGIGRMPDPLQSIFGASLPMDNPTKSFWLNTEAANPLAEVGSTGELTQDADVCIIGSGITGVSAAWHLSNGSEKPSVVILEAREFCSGATGRNGGHLVRNVFNSFISRQASHNTSEAIKTYLLEKYTADSLVAFINDRNLQDEVDLVEGGHITLLRTEQEETDARNDYEAAKAAGLISDGKMGVRWLGNVELQKKYGLSPALNYTGVWYSAHNLWPSKLVTALFHNTSNVVLHTKTPVTSVLPVRGLSRDSVDQIPLSHPEKQRRWVLGTPRGDIKCSYVVHATNAYSGYLLPFMADRHRSKMCPDIPSDSKTVELLPDAELKTTTTQTGADRSPPLTLRHDILPSPKVHTIVPTRGQVGAVRALANTSALGWLNAWDGGGGGWEYWFPRYQGTNVSVNPLIILGGGREHAGGRLEAGVADDAALNPRVSASLHEFLPSVFPGQFAADEGWEMEWTGIMGFTASGEPFVGSRCFSSIS
ncbi:hypothetical protein HYPSUDRAFT_47784 [Hypholoma sublateritium FD-334 SS-4]|uniref:FAD dependent oxidoreductase domain-containing protein n=1 Tax=Hypholoma sublateritium (strain FD-334 SS-4) TaxID=945553 RepID=A0A0D2NA81_HYPSF|nr:hypothetical protein HYPSUDRAFT_47784 [Hypholoma sublateritium FD-334 SS-4]